MFNHPAETTHISWPCHSWSQLKIWYKNYAANFSIKVSAKDEVNISCIGMVNCIALGNNYCFILKTLLDLSLLFPVVLLFSCLWFPHCLLIPSLAFQTISGSSFHCIAIVFLFYLQYFLSVSKFLLVLHIPMPTYFYHFLSVSRFLPIQCFRLTHKWKWHTKVDQAQENTEWLWY